MTPAFKALVIVALILSGISLVISNNAPVQESARPPQKVAPVDTAALQESLNQLTAELITISARLDALETPATKDVLAGKKGQGGSKDALVGEAAIAAKVEEAVEKALDQQGVDLVKKAQREAKREGNRAGFDKFVSSYGEGLPQVYQSITDKMNLDRNRQQQLEETLEAGWARMDEMTAQLFNNDLAPEEERELMGEIKSVGGETIQELGTFLNPGEMMQLGEIMMSTEGTERMGWSIAGAAKESASEEESSDGRP
jgi:hypothetical protein